MSATLQLVQPRDASMKLVLFAPDRELATLLSALLPSLGAVQWLDSAAPASALEPLRDTGCVVLLDYRHENAAFSAALTRQLQAQAPELPLVAIGSTHADHMDGVVTALRAGLRDLLDLDSTPQDMEAVLRRAAALAAQGRNSAPVAPPARARMVLLLGVRPGVGSSTLAAHLGVLSEQAAARQDTAAEPAPSSAGTLLLDLGQPTGDLTLYLNVDPTFHFDDALRNAARIDATLARTAMAHHPAGVTLLGQPPGMEGTALADPGMLMQRLRSVFHTVLCDLGGVPLRQLPVSLLNSADEIWLIADQSIGTLVSLDQMLRHLTQVGARDARLQLVINRHDDASGLSPAQIAARFEVPLLAVLPDRPTLRSSASHGRLLLQDAPRDPYVRALAPLLSHLDPTAPAPARGWREHLALRLSGSPWKTK
jgi:pilus assembly protein CpaE